MKKIVIFFFLGILLNGFVSLLFIPLSLIAAVFIYAAKKENEQKPFWLILASFSGSIIGFTIAIFILTEETNPIYLGVWSASYAIIIYIISALSPLFLKEKY